MDIDDPLDSAELYNPAMETWSLTDPMMGFPRTGHTATLLRTGKVLVAGALAPVAAL